MKVLIVDYMASVGHRVFNEIHIGAIQQNPIKLVLLSKPHYFDDFKTGNLEVKWFPQFLFKKYHNKRTSQVMERLQDIIKLCLVKKYIHKDRYDCVIFLCYDIMSLFFFRTNIPVVLFNHYNVDDMENKYKRYLTRILPDTYIHVALTNYINERIMQLLPQKKSFVIHHGIKLPKKIENIPPKIVANQKYIYCPVSSSCDNDLLNRVFLCEDVIRFLIKNDIIVLIKGDAQTPDNEFIKHIPSRLEDGEYYYMLSHAVAVFLPYLDTFRYRVSGVVHECFAFGIPFISNDTDSYDQYIDYVNYSYKVSNGDTFIKSLTEILEKRVYYKNLDQLSPIKGWKALFDAINKN